MDDSAANNIFNDPITGAGKNEDFLEAPSPAEAGQRVEKPAVTEGREKDYNASRQEKTGKSGRNRAEHPAAATLKDARAEHRVTSELTDMSEQSEAAAKLEQVVEEARGARDFLQRVTDTTRDLRKRGGNLLVRQVLPIAAMLTLAGVAMYVDRTGSGWAQMAASAVPEAWKGWMAAATDEESRLITAAAEKRGIDTEKVKGLQLADKVVAAGLGAIGSRMAGEAASFVEPTEAAIKAAGAVEHVAHKYVEGPALKIIKRRKERRGTEAALNAAGVVEPVSEQAKTESRQPEHIRRARRWVKASKSGGSSRPEGSRPETPHPRSGPGNSRETDTYRARRSERRAAERAMSKGKTNARSRESSVMAH